MEMVVTEKRGGGTWSMAMIMTSPSPPCEVVLTTAEMRVVEERAKAKGRVRQRWEVVRSHLRRVR